LSQKAMQGILSWCQTGSYREPRLGGRGLGTRRFEDPDIRAVAEAIQFLERAGLVMRDLSGGDVTWVEVGLTRLGRDALATNSVRRHLRLSDTPPMA
jgi:hypothetical protein